MRNRLAITCILTNQTLLLVGILDTVYILRVPDIGRSIYY